MALVACSTHALLVDSLLFAGPVIMIALVLLVVTWRERRRERGGFSSPELRKQRNRHDESRPRFHGGTAG